MARLRKATQSFSPICRRLLRSCNSRCRTAGVYRIVLAIAREFFANNNFV